MIPYRRTQWYGLSYICRLKGSLILRALPAMIFSALISGAASAGVLDYAWYGEWPEGGPWDSNPEDSRVLQKLLDHPYSMQLFGIVFGYLCVSRLNVSYNRYWEGVSLIKTMHSKWTDACGQILAFDRVADDSTDIRYEPFCRHVVRLFSQLSSLSTMRLHIDDFKSHTRQETASEWLDLDSLEEVASDAVKAAPSLAVDVDSATQQHVRTMSEVVNAADKALSKMHRVLTPEEIDMLVRARCPVHSLTQRIIRSISTRHQAGGIRAPPPIVSRIFQELSNGMLAYNQACKMKEVPMPFAYVQFNAMLLCIFILVAPLTISCFALSYTVSAATSFVIVGEFVAVWLMANEMEDPFGTEENDMPMLAYHEEFCATLQDMLTIPWMKHDQWVVSGGEWREPDEVLGIDHAALKDRWKHAGLHTHALTPRGSADAAKLHAQTAAMTPRGGGGGDSHPSLALRGVSEDGGRPERPEGAGGRPPKAGRPTGGDATGGGASGTARGDDATGDDGSGAMPPAAAAAAKTPTRSASFVPEDEGASAPGDDGAEAAAAAAQQAARSSDKLMRQKTLPPSAVEKGASSDLLSQQPAAAPAAPAEPSEPTEISRVASSCESVGTQGTDASSAGGGGGQQHHTHSRESTQQRSSTVAGDGEPSRRETKRRSERAQTVDGARVSDRNPPSEGGSPGPERKQRQKKTKVKTGGSGGGDRATRTAPSTAEQEVSPEGSSSFNKGTAAAAPSADDDPMAC